MRTWLVDVILVYCMAKGCSAVFIGQENLLVSKDPLFMEHIGNVELRSHGVREGELEAYLGPKKTYLRKPNDGR